MMQGSDENRAALLDVPNLKLLPKTLVVHGITPQVGTTSIAANVALLLAARGEQVLLLDMSLWNCDLTQSFGHTTAPTFLQLAEQFTETGTLASDALNASVHPCRPNLDLLSGVPHWIESPALRAENGWNFVSALLVQANAHWDFVVADLGSSSQEQVERAYTFAPVCATHAALLESAHAIVAVCDSIEYLKQWQVMADKSASMRAETLYIVNRHRRDLPFGLDRYRLNETMRTHSYLIPTLHSGLLPAADGLFFVERAAGSDKPMGEENTARHALQELANRALRQPA